MFRKDREVRIGGGVALYIKQSIQAYAFQIDNVVNYLLVKSRMLYYTMLYWNVY